MSQDKVSFVHKQAIPTPPHPHLKEIFKNDFKLQITHEKEKITSKTIINSCITQLKATDTNHRTAEQGQSEASHNPLKFEITDEAIHQSSVTLPGAQ